MKESSPSPFFRHVLTGVLLVGFLVATVFLLRLGQGKPPLAASDFPRAKGPVDAPIQVIEYSDFQCPACQVAQSTLAELFVQYPGKIRLIFQHYPLEGHPWSPLAHRAVECAARQNQFWVYHDRLYRDQSNWSKTVEAPVEAFLGYARDGGLALDQFADCLGESEVDRIVGDERRAGFDLGVRSTPSFFVNGKLAVGAKGLREEIEKILNSQASTQSA